MSLLPIDIIIELFDRVIAPILLYSSEVFGYNNVTKLDVLQRSFYKRILKLSKATPNGMIYGETGTLPLSITINKRMINFWLRIITSDPNKLSFKIYKHIIQLDNSNVYSTHWLSHIKQILQHCGLFYVWLNQVDIIDVCTVKLLINTRIDDMYEQTWYVSISSHVRYSSYLLFKSERKLELYLYKLNDSQRINLSKFRCRSNYLPISKVYKEHHMCGINCINCNYNIKGIYLYVHPLLRRERHTTANFLVFINSSS